MPVSLGSSLRMHTKKRIHCRDTHITQHSLNQHRPLVDESQRRMPWRTLPKTVQGQEKARHIWETGPYLVRAWAVVALNAWSWWSWKYRAFEHPTSWPHLLVRWIFTCI